MRISTDEARRRIRTRVCQLASALGRLTGDFGDDDVLPRTGLLDSASLVALIVWYEGEFGLSTDDEELTLDNFGTVNLMVDYVRRRG